MNEAKELLDSLNLSTAEDLFIKASQTGNTAKMNYSRIISEFYFIKKLEEISQRNSESSRKQARALIIFTGGLFFVGIVQIILLVI